MLDPKIIASTTSSPRYGQTRPKARARARRAKPKKKRCSWRAIFCALSARSAKST